MEAVAIAVDVGNKITKRGRNVRPLVQQQKEANYENT